MFIKSFDDTLTTKIQQTKYSKVGLGVIHSLFYSHREKVIYCSIYDISEKTVIKNAVLLFLGSVYNSFLYKTRIGDKCIFFITEIGLSYAISFNDNNTEFIYDLMYSGDYNIEGIFSTAKQGFIGTYQLFENALQSYIISPNGIINLFKNGYHNYPYVLVDPDNNIILKSSENVGFSSFNQVDTNIDNSFKTHSQGFNLTTDGSVFFSKEILTIENKIEKVARFFSYQGLNYDNDRDPTHLANCTYINADASKGNVDIGVKSIETSTDLSYEEIDRKEKLAEVHIGVRTQDSEIEPLSDTVLVDNIIDVDTKEIFLEAKYSDQSKVLLLLNKDGISIETQGVSKVLFKIDIATGELKIEAPIITLDPQVIMKLGGSACFPVNNLQMCPVLGIPHGTNLKVLA